MISEAEILHIITEIHQYDVILVELKDGTIFGIQKAAESEPVYFRTRTAARTSKARRALLDAVSVYQTQAHIDCITLETLLDGLRGMRTRHVWLEKRSEPSREMAFLSLKELGSYLRRQET